MMPRGTRRNWIIPAYAGSTPPVGEAYEDAEDHPRIRGEHDPNRSFGEKMAGSSPHTRGALVLLMALCVLQRIIPAYAGSTRRRCRWLPADRDHPRIRGEHLNRIKNEMPAEGSSPHTRGARGSRPVVPARHGIIPAYAGSTRPSY